MVILIAKNFKIPRIRSVQIEQVGKVCKKGTFEQDSKGGGL